VNPEPCSLIEAQRQCDAPRCEREGCQDKPTPRPQGKAWLCRCGRTEYFPPDCPCQKPAPVTFMTTRDELFTRLCLGVPSGFVEGEGKHGMTRVYHKTLPDFLAAFWKFCDEKEAASGN